MGGHSTIEEGWPCLFWQPGVLAQSCERRIIAAWVGFRLVSIQDLPGLSRAGGLPGCEGSLQACQVILIALRNPPQLLQCYLQIEPLCLARPFRSVHSRLRMRLP